MCTNIGNGYPPKTLLKCITNYFLFINKIKILEALIFLYCHAVHLNMMFTNIYICKYITIIFTNFALKSMKVTYPLPSEVPGCALILVSVGFEVILGRTF